MQQLERDARFIATQILEHDGEASSPASRLFGDLYEMAKELLKAPRFDGSALGQWERT